MRGTNAYNLPDSGGTSFKTRFPLLAAIIITVLVAAGLAAFLIWVGYSFLLRPSTRLDGIGYRDLVEVVKIALAVVAGIGGTAALTVAVRKQKVAERQHKLSEADANRQDRRILDERFQNAVEQLGKTDSAAVRIGGAYSLAKLADDWPAERQPASTCFVDTCVFRMIRQAAPMVREKFDRPLLELCASIYCRVPRLAGTDIYSTLAGQSSIISISVTSTWKSRHCVCVVVGCKGRRSR